MTKKIFIAALTVVMLSAAAFANTDPVRYEAEAATVTAPANVANLAGLSGGAYVRMEAGNLTFAVNAPSAGFYTIWAHYSQTYDNNKEQNLVINGTAVGTISFPLTSSAIDAPVTVATFTTSIVAGKVRLAAGNNTVAITNNWGWVDIDYIEVGPFVPTPFNLTTTLVTPNASVNARKVFQFLRENFQQKVLSGVMTGDVMVNNSNPACNIANQPEMAHVKAASGKFPAIIGLDFMHSTGRDSEGSWFRSYHNATLSLAEEAFEMGGIPTYAWHWKDPLKATEQNAFYTEYTNFTLANAFSDAANTTFNTSSPEYVALLADIDFISGELKKLADKGVPVLWRPLHEAAGGWFWWGRGARGNATQAVAAANACRNLWRLMFNRMVNHHGLDNLIWVWTTEESGRELEWYPGDQYVDIIGRDWYPSPNQQAKVHGSLVANFENIKNIFGTSKMIALSENGPIPHPDSLVNDGAYWSWFMPWNREFTTQVNTAAEWNYIMNHNYVIALEDMPGWANYQLATTSISNTATRRTSAQGRGAISVRSHRGTLELRIDGVEAQSVELFNLKGSKIAVLSRDRLTAGNHRFPVKGVARQMSFVKVKTVDNRVMTLPVRIE
jgi:mannan endo-1,4-beta-mannosidase